MKYSFRIKPSEKRRLYGKNVHNNIACITIVFKLTRNEEFQYPAQDLLNSPYLKDSPLQKALSTQMQADTDNGYFFNVDRESIDLALLFISGRYDNPPIDAQKIDIYIADIDFLGIPELSEMLQSIKAKLENEVKSREQEKLQKK